MSSCYEAVTRAQHLKLSCVASDFSFREFISTVPQGKLASEMEPLMMDITWDSGLCIFSGLIQC